MHLPTIQTWTPDHSDWPTALDDLHDPPDQLRIAGHLPTLDRAVAIVGTRSADTEGIDFAHDLAYDLASAGCPIISGGARGVDAAAHHGAMAAGGPTVAVLATGLVPPYPPENESLFESIPGRGALLTEVEDGTAGQPGRFLSRNRLVAALAKVVIVVQAPHRSGALNTAAIADKLGRAVLAMPSSPWDPRGKGGNRLLAAGHGICTSARDVLSVPALGAVDNSAPLEKGEKTHVSLDVDTDQALVLKAIGARVRHASEIAEMTNMPADQVQGTLLHLMLQGLVEERPGGRYARTQRKR